MNYPHSNATNNPNQGNKDQDLPQTIIKQSSFKLKLFSVIRKKDKSELKDERESIKRTLYKCPYCNKDYSSITRYEVHFRTHTGEKPYDCGYCNKKFNEKGNLKAHIRIHTGEKPYKCFYNDCTMSFKTKGQLNDHSHKHSTIRPFKCTICHSAFNRKIRLKVHMMIHSGQKPFNCTYPGCAKYFREKGNLTSHYKKHFKTQGNHATTINKEDDKEVISMQSTSSNNEERNTLHPTELLDIIKPHNHITDTDEMITGTLFTLPELNYHPMLDYYHCDFPEGNHTY